MRTPKRWFRKSEGRWYVQVGKRQVCLGPDEREAFRRFARLMLEEGLTANVPFPAVNVASICDLFLEWSARHNQPVTYRWYKQFLQEFCKWHGTLDVANHKPFHVTKWLDGHKWNASSRRCAIGAVKRAFSWAADEGLIAESPIKKIRKPAVNRRDTILTPEQQQAALAAASDESFRDFLFALQETGCRPAAVTQDLQSLAHTALGRER